LSRFPRSSLFYFALVVLLGLVFWFTWQSIQGSQGQDTWKFSDLMSAAANGQVKSLEINGTDGTVVGVDGKKHVVTLPDCTGECPYETELYKTDKVALQYDKNSGGNYLLSVLLPNIILVSPHRRLHVVGAPPDAERQQPGHVLRKVSGSPHRRRQACHHVR